MRSLHTTRYKTRFLFLPKTINGETKWLQFAMWREYTEYDASRNIKFVPKEWMDI